MELIPFCHCRAHARKLALLAGAKHMHEDEGRLQTPFFDFFSTVYRSRRVGGEQDPHLCMQGGRQGHFGFSYFLRSSLFCGIGNA
jgi:hypothetical protein